jgi:D-2-hydroxyacid dehydrogenase (NADP+)
MKPEGVFISIGRGLAVDEIALAAALESKSIAAAAIDVYKAEPLPESSPLWMAENVLLTVSPHCCTV